MSAQHTPGPWTHEGQGDITGIENDLANGCVGKVDVACVYLRTVPGRTEANARLIAAAPDLLAAAQTTLAKNLHLADGDNCTLIDLKRAVERITGVEA